ncbi:MAG: nucleotide exchange factor GrpE [Bacteroidales bacterium]|nr:nucleotide exchange factor GrpE [Bacteroidales bacterium]
MSKISEEEKKKADAQKTNEEVKSEQKSDKKADKKAAKEESKIAELEKQIADLNDKVSKEKDDYVRLMAEFETFRRRTSEQNLELVKTASAEVIKGLLPVLDDCEQGLKLLKSDDESRKGIELIYTKLTDYLKGKGLEKIEAQGKAFDTDFHEALTQIPAPTEDMKGKVIEVYQNGYMLNGKILRYAKVVVGA